MKNSNLSLVQFMSLTHHQHTSQTLTCNHKPSPLFTNVYPAIIIHKRMFCDHYSQTYVLRSLFTKVCSAIIIHYSPTYVLRSLFTNVCSAIIIHQRMFCDHYSPTYVLRSCLHHQCGDLTLHHNDIAVNSGTFDWRHLLIKALSDVSKVL